MMLIIDSGAEMGPVRMLLYAFQVATNVYLIAALYGKSGKIKTFSRKVGCN